MSKSKSVKNNSDIKVDVSDLDINFLKLENNKENIIYSPLSIKYALSMLKEGASGNTLTEIENALGDTNLPSYENIDKVLSLANAMFVRDTFKNKLKDEYVSILKSNYAASLKFDEFKDAKNVNKWIEEKTFNILKNVISDDLVQDEYLKILLINALAIDMKWEEEFDESDTYADTFRTGDNKDLEVTMMHLNTKSENVKYYSDDEMKIVSLPLKKYGDNRLEFIAIMPSDKLSNYISNLTVDKLNEVIGNLKGVGDNEKLALSIPKFAYDYKLDFMNDLEKIGIKEVFTPDANLDKISSENLYVSEAIHKADIKFSEEGIRAAAVTVFAMKVSGMFLEEEIIDLKLDKPFIYLIKDSDNDTVWFVGSVYKPNLWENDKEEYGY